MSEEMLVYHCAPTLAGMKTGSLFSCAYGCRGELVATIRRWNGRLAPKGLRVLPLRYLEGRALIYVYRPGDLAADLADERARAILAQADYRGRSVEQCVAELARRLRGGAAFPHEVGLFLSYPPEDVLGFMEHRGADCKCVGCWKVYGDAEQARLAFDRYRRCTEQYCARWSKGMGVERLAVPTACGGEKGSA